jgi:hypothetical protein
MLPRLGAERWTPTFYVVGTRLSMPKGRVQSDRIFTPGPVLRARLGPAQFMLTTPWRTAKTSACSLECAPSFVRMLVMWLRSVLRLI